MCCRGALGSGCCASHAGPLPPFRSLKNGSSCCSEATSRCKSEGGGTPCCEAKGSVPGETKEHHLQRHQTQLPPSPPAGAEHHTTASRAVREGSAQRGWTTGLFAWAAPYFLFTQFGRGLFRRMLTLACTGKGSSEGDGDGGPSEVAPAVIPPVVSTRFGAAGALGWLLTERSSSSPGACFCPRQPRVLPLGPCQRGTRGEDLSPVLQSSLRQPPQCFRDPAAGLTLCK